MNIHIPQSRSLKAKRQIVTRIKQRVRNSFNVSLAEKPSDKWQVCELSFACVNYTKASANDIIDRIEDSLRVYTDVQILASEKEIF